MLKRKLCISNFHNRRCTPNSLTSAELKAELIERTSKQGIHPRYAELAQMTSQTVTLLGAAVFNMSNTLSRGANCALFDAGYEREWFSQYEVDPAALERYRIHQRMGLVVPAVAPDGTIFRVCISTTPNIGHLTTDKEDGRIATDLYYVVQTSVNYANGDEGQRRDINIEGIFMTYDKAQSFAHNVLLSEEDGITKESFAEYDEAGDNERDC
ncbi:hypothetical protein V502_03402 [Pseudogymnoascus sp. VKM F-4520 (FW-2644)]|nr:hypothetical protein V502_03402 [Pseudogymnoascus sp. VKM F-4520 (FW-2644)]